MLLDDPSRLVGTSILDKYHIHTVIAEGGFGVVYRATHLTLDKTVAVKVLKVPEHIGDAARQAFLARFAQEARTIAALEHPAIVRVIDFGSSLMPDGVEAPWMVLEWLEGTTLAEELDARRGRGGRSPAEVLALL